MHTCNPSNWKMEAGGSWVYSQPEQRKKYVSYVKLKPSENFGDPEVLSLKFGSGKSFGDKRS